MARDTNTRMNTARNWTAVAGWTVSYFEPTYGMRSFRVCSHPELAAAKVWLDAGGYMYSTREIPKGA